MPDQRSTREPGAGHRLEARLLGGLELRYDGRAMPEDAFHRRKSLLLLLRLLVEPGRRLPVDTILEMLWPEEDAHATAVRLRAVLSEIRLALPVRGAPNPVVRLEAALALDPALRLEVDADRFEAACAQDLSGDPEALRRALALYGGPLLPALAYEGWAQERRAGLARLQRQAVLALATEGDPGAEGRLRGLLAEDPADERAGQVLLRLLGAQGRRAEGLRAHHALVRALEEELGVDPEPETAALHAALLEPPAPSPPAPGPRPEAPPHNLPSPPSSFVGRTWERAELRQLLARTRLLTLVGPGGCGKTRLALAAAGEALGDLPRGAWLVDLAPLPPGGEAAPAVARALGAREEAGRPLLETLVARLQGAAALLVLDNCEHLLGECAALAEGLLRGCPELRILATSRERLGLPGEVAWPVPPLALPAGGDEPGVEPPSPARLAQAEAVQLLVERIRGVRPGFAIGEANAAAVARICRRLDGIPLALELAAARAGTLSVEGIAARLDDRFRLLTGGSRTALPRQRTLRASLDWSYELLGEAERTLLGRLAVFAGGWTLEAAEAVCAGEAIEAAAVLDLMDGLVSKSMVQVEQTEGGAARYRLLETVRQYAAERQEERGEGAALRKRHLAWCLALAELAEPELRGPEQGAWLDRLEAEHDNLRAALGWGLAEDMDGGEPAAATGEAGGVPSACAEEARHVAGLRLTAALWRFWWVHGHLSEGRRWLERAVAEGDAAPAALPPTLRASVLNGAGNLALAQADFGSARRWFEESLALRRRVDDRPGIAASLHSLGNVADDQGDHDRARALQEECLSIRRELGDAPGIATTLSTLGLTLLNFGEHRQARALQEESLAIMRGLGDTWGISSSLLNLGTVAYLQGEYQRAGALYEESLHLARQLGDSGRAARALGNLGMVACKVGEYGRARSLHVESLALFWHVGEQAAVADALEGLAAALGAPPAPAGSPRRAALLLGAAARLRASIGYGVAPSDRAGYEQDVAAVRAALGEAAFAAAWAEGQAMPLEAAVAVALEGHTEASGGR